MSTLSQADVARLMTDPSADVRAETAVKIAQGFEQQSLNDSERQIAEDIFRAMVKDAEVRVREALAVHLKTCPDVSHDVAVALAQDVESVSLPMLKYSEVLTDDDLIEIVKGQSADKQSAIAQRPQVSAGVADALIDTGNEAAVARLVSNQGAELNEQALGKVAETYAESDSVSDSLVRRPNLPPALSEQLVSALTEKMQSVLQSKHDVDADAISNVVLQARERATVSLLSEGSSDDDLERMVEQMHVKGRLTGSMMLRALAMGDLSFFEMGIARLCSIPVQNARILIHDQGGLGLKSVYERAGLPEKLYPAFRAAIEVIGETEYDGGPNDRERYISKMVERLLTHFEDPGNRIEEDDVKYLMGKLNQIAA